MNCGETGSSSNDVQAGHRFVGPVFVVAALDREELPPSGFGQVGRESQVLRHKT